MAAPLASANLALLRRLTLAALLMFAFAWGLIPLYRVICEATGLNRVVSADGLPKEQAGLSARPVSLVLDATTEAGLPWQVRPLTRLVAGRTGDFIQLEYEITNNSNRRVVGQAIPRYLPAEAAAHVRKLECFCFSQQAFSPGETRRFPVVLVIDKALPAGVDSVTLGYTVYEVPSGQEGRGS
ncbi:cytochrome c oxidase assembly protein [uncultured Aquitalea sp.]|uniref:cytochrome c oxidase assembly protein n=1 Tax=uncultured Aquitalea sp. TaxID=540272 RepID=UPI0025CE5C0F|nr:cytochrome c oxidase assembly protein [uncultured Aquitalea sp.]